MCMYVFIMCIPVSAFCVLDGHCIFMRQCLSFQGIYTSGLMYFKLAVLELFPLEKELVNVRQVSSGFCEL